MSNFSNDSHLLKWEPDVFRLCRFPQQKLGGGSTGQTSSGSVSFSDATSGDFKLRVTDLGGKVLGTTAVIPFNETAAHVQTALNAITGVTVGLPTGVGSVADPM